MPFDYSTPGALARDGRCHNAEIGTFGHECGQPADWIGTKPNGFRSGFCNRCHAHGSEARSYTVWHRAPTPMFLASEPAWDAFYASNREELDSMFESVPASERADAARRAASRGELLIGGGAAPLFNIVCTA